MILQYEKGYRVVYFDEGEKPEVKFYQDEPVIASMHTVNQHGLLVYRSIIKDIFNLQCGCDTMGMLKI